MSFSSSIHNHSNDMTVAWLAFIGSTAIFRTVFHSFPPHGILSHSLGLIDDAFAWFSSNQLCYFHDGIGDPSIFYETDYTYSLDFVNKFTSIQQLAIEEGEEESFISHEHKKHDHRGYSTIKAKFLSPIAHTLPNEVDVRTGRIEIVLPANVANLDEVISKGGPIVIHLPGTGDEGFGFRRKLLATPLARDHQVTSIILQIPFYGKRRLSSQPSSALPYVEYMLSQSTGVVMEAIALIRYLREQKQYHGKLGLTGISFGGSMSALAGILCPHSIDIITNVPANSPNDAYVEGIMQHSIDWTLFPNRKESVSTLLTIMNIGGLVETTKASRSYDRLTNIRKSYYQLTAKHDKYIPWKNSLYLYENMKNLQYCHHAELILIPGGHVSSIVVYKQQYLETILKALRNNA